MRMTVLFLSAAFVTLFACAAADARAQDETVYTVGDGVTAPVLVKTVKAVYTREAMDQRIEGSVLIETVVRSDGKVGDAKVAKSLDSVYGLDQEALKAVRQYEFKPATRDKKAVAVRVTVEVTFTLK